MTPGRTTTSSHYRVIFWGTNCFVQFALIESAGLYHNDSMIANHSVNNILCASIADCFVDPIARCLRPHRPCATSNFTPSEGQAWQCCVDTALCAYCHDVCAFQEENCCRKDPKFNSSEDYSEFIILMAQSAMTVTSVDEQ